MMMDPRDSITKGWVIIILAKKAEKSYKKVGIAG